MRFHEDRFEREDLIRRYLLRRLDADRAEAFESHYLECDECFEELRATQLLMASLAQPKLDRRRLEDVLLLEFTAPVQLVRQSKDAHQLLEGVLEQKDTKVLIDLSRVSRIDSAGLGMLMKCYSHVVFNHGVLKLLKPSAEVEKLLRMTRIDSVVETYQSESEALQSFQSGV